jgi:adenylate kinase family enzyme
MPSIFLITGPPGAGKSTLANALMQRFEFGVHIPVDNLRLLVASGRHDVDPWTEETERQFRVAEQVMCAMTKRYVDNGFAVAIDHCRSLARLDQVLADEGLEVKKILLLPSLEITQERNRVRTNKDFDTSTLVNIITYVSDRYREEDHIGWQVIDNSQLSVDETIELILDCG